MTAGEIDTANKIVKLLYDSPLSLKECVAILDWISNKILIHSQK